MIPKLLRRRWAVLGLRGLLVLILIIGLGLGYLGRQASNLRQAKGALEKCGGYIIWEDRFVWLGGARYYDPQQGESVDHPTWFRRVLGDDVFHQPRAVLLMPRGRPVGPLPATPEVDIHRAMTLVRRLEGIEAIDVSDYPINDAQLQTLLAWPDLRRLELENTSGLFSAGFAEIAKLRNLRELKLGNLKDGKLALAMAAELPQLEDLSLDQKAGVEVPFGLMDDQSDELRAKWFREGEFGPAVFQKDSLKEAKARFLQKYADQNSLNLRNFTDLPFTDADLASLRNVEDLKSLSLPKSLITNAGARALQAAVPTLKTIKVFPKFRHFDWMGRVQGCQDDVAEVQRKIATVLPGMTWGISKEGNRVGHDKGMLYDIQVILRGSPKVQTFVVIVNRAYGGLVDVDQFIKPHGWTVEGVVVAPTMPPPRPPQPLTPPAPELP